MFIRQKAEETGRQTDKQTNKQTNNANAINNTKDMPKMNKFLLCSYIIVKRNADTAESIRSGIKEN